VLVAAAVCPHPPLLVPGVAAGASAEVEPLRDACREAVRTLVAADPQQVVVVGTAPRTGPYAAGARGSLRPFGVVLQVGRGDGPVELPLALAVAEWLVDEVPVAASRLHFGVEPDLPADRAAALGAGLADRAERVALLAMGDGSSRRTVKGPGHLDEAAEPFDAAVGAALAEVDVDALLGLDPAKCERLLVGGRVPWQVLAGAADGGSYLGSLRQHSAPYGIAYLVATWRRAAAAPDEEPG
jgi:hypothetical protein